MKLSIFISQITQMLQTQTQIDNPRLEADLLAAHVLKLSRAQLYSHSEQELNEAQSNLILTLVKRRSQGEPLAYILGYKEFWSLNLRVNEATLIPRPETELLVEWVLQHFVTDALLVADLGTGSGAIAAALASEKPNWKIIATDYSLEALHLARINAAELDLNSIEFRLGNWCEALETNNYDLIISNPPYIAENDPHLDFLKYEPSTALCAKEEGLADLKTIISQARNHLKTKGLLVLEHGYNQGQVVRSLLKEHDYTSIHTERDLSGNERFTIAHA